MPWTFSIKSFPRILTIKHDGCLKPSQKALITPVFCLSFNASPKSRFEFVQQNESGVWHSVAFNKQNKLHIFSKRAEFNNLKSSFYMLGYKNVLAKTDISYSIQYFDAYICLGQRQEFHTIVVTRNTGGPKTSWKFWDFNNFKERSYKNELSNCKTVWINYF